MLAEPAAAMPKKVFMMPMTVPSAVHDPVDVLTDHKAEMTGALRSVLRSTDPDRDGMTAMRDPDGVRMPTARNVQAAEAHRTVPARNPEEVVIAQVVVPVVDLQDPAAERALPDPATGPMHARTVAGRSVTTAAIPRTIPISASPSGKENATTASRYRTRPMKA